MLDILTTIIPVFLIIASGYLVVKTGYFKEALAEHLNAVTSRFMVPVLLFHAMYNLEFANAMRWQVLVGFYAGAFASFAITIVMARKIFNRRPGEAVAVGFSATFSNSVLIGIPVVERAFGPEILPLAYGIIAFHASSIYAVGLTTMEFSRSDGLGISQTLKTSGKAIIGNALMIGILTGVAFNLAGVNLPETVTSATAMIAQAAIPIALIGVGAALPAYKIKTELKETLMVTFMSLIFHPAIALLIVWGIFDMPTPFVQVAVMIAAMPPGVNIYIFATLFNRAVALSASAFVVATSISIITISAWLAFLAHLL